MFGENNLMGRVEVVPLQPLPLSMLSLWFVMLTSSMSSLSLPSGALLQPLFSLENLQLLQMSQNFANHF